MSTEHDVISLPQGGGALKGIGEKFSPDLFTGTGNFTVPIAVPNGRNGLQPQLVLSYSTGNGNGPFGLGWSLSIPGISRKTSQGIPRYRDDPSDGAGRPDVFILSGAEDLVPVDGAPDGAQRYRPRTEGLFALIDRHRDATNDFWRVQGKDGLVSVYGTAAMAGSDPAAVVDPARRGKVFAWRLTRTEDPFGNGVDYEYRRDTGSAGPHRWDQLYLRRIRYIDYTDAAGQTQYLASVTFLYDDDLAPPGAGAARERPDPFSDYRAGFEIRTTRRCKWIVVRTHPAGTAEQLVRTYELVYLDERSDLPDLADVLPHNGVSLLSRVEVIGYDDAAQPARELPPLEFGYSRFEPEKRRFSTVTGHALPSTSLADPSLELIDLFGNGLPDILEINDTVRYWRNLGGGRFDVPRLMNEAPAGLRLADSGVQLIDANGDGRADLLVTTGELAGYYPLAFQGGWDRNKSFQRYAHAPSFSLEDPEVRLVDLDGDGVTDAIRSGSRMECYFNDPLRGWQPGPDHSRRVERRALEQFPDVSFSDPRVKWADMTGDGLQDVVLIHNGRVDYWPNLGYGDFGPRVTMQDAPRLPLDYDPRRLLLGDVDGDGLADVIYIENRRLTLWINRSGNGWSAPVVIEGTPAVTDLDAVRLVDLLGTGVTGVLWTRDADGSGRPLHYFFDFTGGEKPGLLNEMDNHLGAITRVAYTASTREYLRDQARGNTGWRTPLPFPVQVVARIEVIDDISHGKFTTEYRYHNGYWDGAEREFRGFGMVEQIDSETFAQFSGTGLHEPHVRISFLEPRHFSAPTLTKTWFHQGPVGEEFGDWEEQDYGNEYWSGDPQLLRHTTQINSFLSTLSTRRIRRDALRVLRSSVLRTELYALDGNELAARPYTVTEHAYELREEQPPAASTSERQRIFFPLAVAQRTTQWERGEDPLTIFEYTADYDLWGQPRRQTRLAMPRLARQRHSVIGAVVGEIAPDETRILLTHVATEYAKPAGSRNLRDRVSQVHSFEFVSDATVDDSVTDTAAEALHKQWLRAEALVAAISQGLRDWQAGTAVPANLRIFDHTIYHYDGAAFQGRVDQRVEYGALTRTETLMFTDGILARAYTLSGEDRRPDYLRGTAALPPGPPAVDAVQLGYRHESGNDGLHQPGYYADTVRNQYDFQCTDPPPASMSAWPRRGVVVGRRDALGNATVFTLDEYWLLSVKVVDAVGLETRTVYNYRLMQPHSLTEPNGNCVQVRYGPLGMPIKQWAESRVGASGAKQGGSEARPDVEYRYDFLVYTRTRKSGTPEPIYAHSRRRVWHASDDQQDEFIEVREYSDGTGRRVQSRTQAENGIFGDYGDDLGLPLDIALTPGVATATVSADHVVVNGWQTYDNKGRVVEKYEPFFSRGWGFQAEAEAKRGRHVEMYYDPRGHVLHTVNPDGSRQRVIYGCPRSPVDLVLSEATLSEAVPPGFAPSPWETYVYDENDLASVSRNPEDDRTLAERAPVSHHFTPASQLTDALGRTVCKIARNGPDPVHWHVTRSAYDIQGNLTASTDALGRIALQYVYDLAKRQLQATSVDAGIRTTVPDALGKAVEYRDSKGSIALHYYDRLNRLTGLWARNDRTQNITRRERIVYGDDLDRAANRDLNRLGQPAVHWDEAGKIVFDNYDFKGNLLGKTRRVISDSTLASGWVADWSATDSESTLAPTLYETGSAYDALNRPIEIRYPQTVATATAPARRPRLTPRYNRAGALQMVVLDGESFVDHIAYNAKGQRVLVVYGNGFMTRTAYDPDSFRLVRMRTERCARTGDSWRGSGELLQNCEYRYDLVGNITTIEERVPNCGVARAGYQRDRLLREFEYDPLYRLLSATGRACIEDPEARRWQDLPGCGFFAGTTATPNQANVPDLSEPYLETFQYDPAGNMLELAHVRAGAVAWRRLFAMGAVSHDQWGAAPNNRLTGLSIGQSNYQYAFDPSGNLARQNTEEFFDWDHKDRMIGYRRQAGTTPTLEARYLYGADGIRVKKWVRENAATSSVVYSDETFEHHHSPGIEPSGENNILHVVDNHSRIALVRVGDAHRNDPGPAVLYHFSDHLDSSSVVISGTGDWINREEYFPYGETSMGSFRKKRYRYAGKERDEESGLSYHGARYFASRLSRWISCDPAGPVDGTNLFQFVRSNPLRHVDMTGNQTADAGAAATTVSEPATGVESRFLTVTPPELDKARICITGNESKSEQARKMRIWSTVGTAVGRDANLTAKVDTAKDFYALHETLSTDATNNLSELVCGDRPFSMFTAGTYSRKEGVKISKEVTDPALKTAVKAHEVYHALADKYLKTLGTEQAGKILDPQKYSVKNLQASLALREELEIDIRRCEEFIAYQVSIAYLFASLSAQEKLDASALGAAYVQQRNQRLFSSSDSQEGVDFAAQRCQQLLPGRYSFDPKTGTGTLTLPPIPLPPDAGTVLLSP